LSHDTHLEWTLSLGKNGAGDVERVTISRDKGGGSHEKIADLLTIDEFLDKSGISSNGDGHGYDEPETFNIQAGRWMSNRSRSRLAQPMIALQSGDEEFFGRVRKYYDYCVKADKARRKLISDVEAIFEKLTGTKLESKMRLIHDAIGSSSRGMWEQANGLCGSNRRKRRNNNACGDVAEALGLDYFILISHVLLQGEVGDSIEDGLDKLFMDVEYSEVLDLREEDQLKLIEKMEVEEITKAVRNASRSLLEGFHEFRVAEYIELFDSAKDYGNLWKSFGDSGFSRIRNLEEAVQNLGLLGLGEMRKYLVDPFINSSLPPFEIGFICPSFGIGQLLGPSERMIRGSERNLKNINTPEWSEVEHRKWLWELGLRIGSLLSKGGLSQGLDYLGATRLSPQRYYEVSNLGERSGVSGERTVSALAEDKKLLESVNKKLDELVGMKVFVERTKSGGYKRDVPGRFYEVRIGSTKDQAFLHLPDVGFGISQVLPLLSAMHTDQTLVVEEPESNLHPKAQAKLIEDILLSKRSDLTAAGVMGKGGKVGFHKKATGNILMETHSEHFLSRVLQLLEKGEIRDEDVALIFVDTTEDGGTVARRVRTKDGVLIDEIPESFANLENHTGSII
jgi:hypothetical protein